MKLKAKSFKVSAKKRKTVRLALPKALRRVLKRTGSLRLRLSAKVKDPAGKTRTVNKRVKPKLKKKKRKKRDPLCAAAIAASLVWVPAAPASTPAGPEASPARARGLTAGQRRRADKLVSQFENSTSKIQYCYVEALDDGRGYTVGRAGFTSATGDLLEVAERYTKVAGGNALSPLLPRLRELAAKEDGSTAGLETLPSAWATTCRDARQRRVQDDVVDEEYYLPARRHWRKLKLRTALSLAAIYDADIQHGDGGDPDGVPAMLRRATRRAHGTPRSGVRESRFLRAFLARSQGHAGPRARPFHARGLGSVGRAGGRMAISGPDAAVALGLAGACPHAELRLQAALRRPLVRHDLEGSKAWQRPVHEEDLHRDVGLDMRLAEKGSHLPAGELFYRVPVAIRHDALEILTHVDHSLRLPAVHDGLLERGEPAAAHHADDDVVDRVGLGLHRPAPVVVAQDPDDGRRDLRQQLAAP